MPPYPAPEGLPRLKWDPTGPELRTIGTELLRAGEERLERLLKGEAPPTLDGFFSDLDRILLEVRDVGSHGSFLFNVHADPEVRAAGRELSEASDRFYNAFRINLRAYERLGALDLAGADLVTRRTVEKMRKEMRRSGVERPPEVRERLRALSDAIDSVSNQFVQNIATQPRSLEVAGVEELKGLPPDYLAAHPAGPDGRIRLTTQYPDYLPVQNYADRAELRSALMHEFMNRAYPDNLAVLSDLLAKRHEFATSLGYPAFSSLAMEDKMTGTREAASRFLREVAEILRPGTSADRERLRLRKRRAGSEEPVNLWDEAYYRNQIRNEEYGVDARELRRFLPYGPVRDGLFALCAELLGLEIRPRAGAPTWHATVEAYEVRRSGAVIGRFYLDMVPRDGKYTHAACFGLRTGIEGTQLPESALVCNFVAPNVAKEGARMEYRDVVTFFHEFGHLLHAMLSGGMPWTYCHQLEWDFVEAPSILFEEWAKDPTTLSRFARDPETGASVPRELLDRLEASDALGRPSFWMRQVALGAIAFAYYDRDPRGLDTTALYDRIWEEHLPGRYPPGYHAEASWGHLTGYSACYYTYTWSLVIARDLLRRFRDRGSLTDPELAQRYAREILAPGGSRPAAESIEAFLGRPFELRAFADWIAESGTGPPRTR